MKNKVSKNILGFLPFISIGIGFALSLFYISKDYSYWIDELWSVNTSLAPLHKFKEYILGDVHPPLYQILLRLWIDLFGPSEVSTRVLSLVLCSIATIFLIKFIKQFGSSNFVYSLFIPLNFTILYYTNESRSYGLLYLMATLLLVNLPYSNMSKLSAKLCIILVATSLTHYFGLFMSFSVLILFVLTNLRNKNNLYRFIAPAFVLLAWPSIHIIFGSLLEKTGGNFWIEPSVPLFVSSKTMFEGPIFLTAGGLIILVVLSTLLVAKKSKLKPLNNNLYEVFSFQLYIVVIFLTLTSIVNIFTPVATTRNFIVLIPFFSFLILGNFYMILENKLIRKAFAMVILVVYSSLSLFTGVHFLNAKSSPRDNWKEAIATTSQLSTGRAVYVDTYDNVTEYYFSKNGVEVKKLLFLDSNDYHSISAPSILIRGKTSVNELFSLGISRRFKIESVYPMKNSSDSIGVYLISIPNTSR